MAPILMSALTAGFALVSLTRPLLLEDIVELRRLEDTVAPHQQQVDVGSFQTCDRFRGEFPELAVELATRLTGWLAPPSERARPAI